MIYRILLLLFIQISLFQSCFSQWELAHTSEFGSLSFMEVPGHDPAIIGSNARYYKFENGQFKIDSLEQIYSLITSSGIRNKTKGYVGGGAFFPAPNYQPNTLFKTSNSGKTWEKIECPITFGGLGHVSAIHPLADGNLILFLDAHGLYKLNPETLVIDSIRVNDFGDLPGLRSFKAFDDDNWLITSQVAIGQNYQHLYTSDGGISWTELYPQIASDDRLIRVEYIDQNTWLGSTKNSLQYLTKSSATTLFTPQDLDLNWNTALHVADSNTFYAAFSNEENTGTIYKSSNGGIDWEIEVAIENVRFDAFYFKGANKAFALANYNQIWQRTPDGTLPTMEPTVFPNPTTANLCFPDYAEIEKVNYEVYDAAARLVLKGTMFGGFLEVDHLTPGTYYINFEYIQDDLPLKLSFVKVN